MKATLGREGGRKAREGRVKATSTQVAAYGEG